MSKNKKLIAVAGKQQALLGLAEENGINNTSTRDNESVIFFNINLLRFDFI
jgi:hypothetical protein